MKIAEPFADAANVAGAAWSVDGGSVLTTNGILHDELVERFAAG